MMGAKSLLLSRATRHGACTESRGMYLHFLDMRIYLSAQAASGCRFGGAIFTMQRVSATGYEKEKKNSRGE